MIAPGRSRRPVCSVEWQHIINPPKGGFTESVLLNAAGHRSAPATLHGYHPGRSRVSEGELHPADPPTVEEIVAVMRSIAHGPKAIASAR